MSNLFSISNSLFSVAKLARSLHGSTAFRSLGVVEQLSDEISVAHLPTGSSRRFWEVVEFRPDASALETWKTPEVLGLHPRDVHLFTQDSGVGQRAMIAPRGNAILFRTEVAKAVIYADKAVLFPARRLQDTVRTAQAIKSALAQRSALPFELKVLESLLSETAQAFDKKTKRMGMVAETIMDDINRNFHASAAELQRSLPITRKLTELQHDIKETLDTIADVANYDDQLQALCLTERKKALSKGAAARNSVPPSTASFEAALRLQQEHQQQPQPEPRPAAPPGGQNGMPPGHGASFSTITAGIATADNTAATGSTELGAEGREDPASSGSSVRGVSTNSNNFELNSYGMATDKEQRDTRQQQQQQQHHSHPFPAVASFPATQAQVATRTYHMRMASRILETYEFRLMGTQGALNELCENLEQTRTVWHMTLDHQRNRVLRVNLLISITSLGGLISTLPAAYFGMNLESGLEEVPGVFWPVIQGSVGMGAACAAFMYGYYKFGPKRRYAARLRDMRSLRDLLYYHMDDLDAIIEAVRERGPLSKSEFAGVVKSAVQGLSMSKEEVELLYRVCEHNREALFELSALMKLEELDHLNDELAHHTS